MDNDRNFSMQDAMRLAQTPAGQQLLSILQQQNSPELKNAMNSAAAGDYAGAREALSSLLDSPEIAALLKQLGGSHG